MKTYVPIYCTALARKDWPARFWEKDPKYRHRTGLALAGLRDGEWICLHCKTPVRVVG